jgi:Fe-S cluster assembly protein SufD
VYSGWVHVRPGAQKTNAMQTSRTILLSEGAFGRSIPNLEIEANDVRCGHAASVGPVEEEQLFYLMSRGISRADAERLIVFGFLNEVLERVTLGEIRESAASAIEAELGRDG